MTAIIATPTVKTTHSKVGPKKLLPVNTVCLQQFSSGRECSMWERYRLITVQIVLFAVYFLHQFGRAVISLLFPNVTSHLNINILYQERGNGGSELHELIMSYWVFRLTAAAWYFSHLFTFLFFFLLSSPEGHSATCSPLIVPNSSEITSFHGCFLI